MRSPLYNPNQKGESYVLQTTSDLLTSHLEKRVYTMKMRYEFSDGKQFPSMTNACRHYAREHNRTVRFDDHNNRAWGPDGVNSSGRIYERNQERFGKEKFPEYKKI